MTEIKVYEEYAKYQQESEEKYGPKTIVLMQIGKFYEIYDVMMCNGIIVGQAKHLAPYLRCKYTKKDSKKEFSSSNPHMCGFQTSFLEDYLFLLTNLGYTAVIIDEIGENPKKNAKLRSIVSIVSPGTTMTKNLSNYCLCVFCDVLFSKSNRPETWSFACGMAACDVITGKFFYFESVGASTITLHNPIQNIRRIQSFLKPNEIVFYTKNCMDIPSLFDYFYRYCGWNSIPNVLNRQTIPKCFDSISFQTETLRKSFQTISKKHPFETTGLQNLYHARLATVCLLEFCREHSKQLSLNCSLPKQLFLDTCELTDTSIEQLHLLPNRNSESDLCLFSILNECLTIPGKRNLRYKICNPYTKSTDILKSWDRLEFCEIYLHSFTKFLPSFADLDALSRKFFAKKLSLNEIGKTLLSCSAFVSIWKIASQKFEKKLFRKLGNTISILSKASKKICYENLSKNEFDLKTKSLTKFESNFLLESETIGYSKICEEIENNLLKSEITKVSSKFFFKPLIRNDENPYNYKIFLSTTESKAKSLSKYGYSYCLLNKGRCMLLSDKLIDLYSKHAEYQEKNRVCCEIFLKSLEKYLQILFENVRIPVDFIAEVDVISSFAKVSKKNGYFRPKIEDSSKSFVSIENLRHPVVEKLVEFSRFIPNDICLKDIPGMLLYGVNTSGKSTLVKSIGICVVMAQIGCFVPGKMTFYPYSRIITRLTGNDDILCGKSSFMIEMLELRTILDKSDASTLVLGDELCRGTEISSGLALTQACLEKLICCNSSFVFATHMHFLAEIPEIVRFVKIQHLTVVFDSEKDMLVYTRKLQPGSGPGMYGIEIAKYLGLDSEFISRSFELRNKSSIKKSKYSSKLYLNDCEICGRRARDTHHLKEQKFANPNDLCEDTGSIFHKNAKFNLVGLCEACHTNIHSKNQSFEKVETSDGYTLVEK